MRLVKDDWIYYLWLEYIQSHRDFYWEDGKKVMTRKYHEARGYCCHSGCRHCPYKEVK